MRLSKRIISILIISMLVISIGFSSVACSLIATPEKEETTEVAQTEKLQIGDEVVTVGGLKGKIKDIEEDVIIITIASGVDVKVIESAVSKEEVQAEEETTTAEPGGIASIFEKYGMVIWIAIMVLVLYFLLIRPQRTRSKKAQEMMSSLQRGDEVVTIGGFHGRIKDIREDAIIMTIASGVDIKINKSAVSKKASQ